MLESKFQKRLIDKITDMFPDCVILKNDANYIQGIPDLLVLQGDRWAMLECKATPSSRLQPNQVYWIDRLEGMSFAALINPENEEVVLDELEQALRA